MQRKIRRQYKLRVKKTRNRKLLIQKNRKVPEVLRSKKFKKIRILLMMPHRQKKVKILRQLQKPPVPQITMQSRTRQISHRQMKMQLQLQLLQMLLQHWLLIQTEASAEAGMIVLR